MYVVMKSLCSISVDTATLKIDKQIFYHTQFILLTQMNRVVIQIEKYSNYLQTTYSRYTCISFTIPHYIRSKEVSLYLQPLEQKHLTSQERSLTRHTKSIFEVLAFALIIRPEKLSMASQIPLPEQLAAHILVGTTQQPSLHEYH